jgi:hypothetical protein
MRSGARESRRARGLRRRRRVRRARRAGEFAESLAEDGNDEKSGGSIRVVAVNGDALLCEYSVGLDKNDTCCAVLERERCVARAEATTRDLATDFAAEASADGEPETADEKKKRAKRRRVRRDATGRVWRTTTRWTGHRTTTLVCLARSMSIPRLVGWT